MRSACTIWFLLVLCNISLAQENTTSLLKQAEVSLYSDPQEAIRIAEYISEKTDNSLPLLKAAYILTQAFYMEGKYDKALKIGLKFSEESESDTVLQLQLNILLSKILKELEINSLAVNYSNKAKNSINTEIDSDSQNWVEGKIIQYGLEKKPEESIYATFEKFYSAKNKFEKITSAQYSSQIGNLDLDIAEMHLREFQLDSAQYYLSSAFRESKKEKPGNYLEMISLINYGDYLFLKKANSEAIDTLNSAMLLAEKFTNLPEQINISEAIAKNYLAMGDLKNFNGFNQKAEQLSSTLGDAENEAVNTAYNFYNSNEAKKFDSLRENSRWNSTSVWSNFYGITSLLGIHKTEISSKN